MTHVSTIILAKGKRTPSFTTSIGALFSYGVYLKQPASLWESCSFITPFFLASICIDETEDDRKYSHVARDFLKPCWNN
jgi:hypothetical protein